MADALESIRVWPQKTQKTQKGKWSDGQQQIGEKFLVSLASLFFVSFRFFAAISFSASRRDVAQHVRPEPRIPCCTPPRESAWIERAKRGGRADRFRFGSPG